MYAFLSYPYICVGQEPDDKTVDGMMSEAPGPLNFTMFLTLFGEKLNGMYLNYHNIIVTLCGIGTDPEDVIKNAFGCFDDEGDGHIHEDKLRELLTTMGDRFTDEEVYTTVWDVINKAIMIRLIKCSVEHPLIVREDLITLPSLEFSSMAQKMNNKVFSR